MRWTKGPPSRRTPRPPRRQSRTLNSLYLAASRVFVPAADLALLTGAIRREFIQDLGDELESCEDLPDILGLFSLSPTFDQDDNLIEFTGLDDHYPHLDKLRDVLAPFNKVDGSYLVWINDEQWVEIDVFLHGKWVAVDVDWWQLMMRPVIDIATDLLNSSGGYPDVQRH